MENVTNPDEFREVLIEKFREFMENGTTFNIHGQWTGDDDVTVSVLVDYGIEDPEEGYYMGSVSARKENNLNKTKDEIVESDTFMDAVSAMTSALYSVFEIPYGVHPEILESDIDYCAHFTIAHGLWEVK